MSVVTNPASITGVATVLGESDLEVYNLCTSDNINRWAKYKPQEFNTNKQLTLAQRKSAYMGLTPLEVDLALTGNRIFYPGAVGDSTRTLDSVVDGMASWAYTKPTTNFRLADFSNPSGTTGDSGYNHLAEPSLTNISNVELRQTTFPTRDWSYDLEVAGSSYSWRKNTSSTNIQPSFNLAFGENASSWIGSCNGNMMPLTWIADTSTGYWRVGLLVWIPSTSSVTRNYWMLVTSDRYLREGSIGGSFLVDLNTNVLLHQFLFEARTSGKITTTAVPVLVKNSYLTTIEYNNYTYRVPTLGYNSAVYYLPENLGSINFTSGVVTSNLPTDEDREQFQNTGINLLYKLSTSTSGAYWFVGFRCVGYTHSGSTFYPINQIVILTTSSVKGRVISGTIKYTLEQASTVHTLTYSSTAKTLSIPLTNPTTGETLVDANGDVVYGSIEATGDRLSTYYDNISLT